VENLGHPRFGKSDNPHPAPQGAIPRWGFRISILRARVFSMAGVTSGRLEGGRVENRQREGEGPEKNRFYTLSSTPQFVR